MPFPSPRLEIDLRQIQANYAALVQRAGGAEVAAVLKADAYGLGAEEVAPALAAVGCRSFWLATTEEAVALRGLLPDAHLYVLNGPRAEDLEAYQTLRLHPVLNTAAQVELWASISGGPDTEPAVLHVETGMNRLGLASETVSLAAQMGRDQRLNLGLIMSHLACAEQPNHPLNQAQLARFEAAKALFPGLPASLSASYGLFLPNPAFHQNMIRVGRALYGLRSATESWLTQPVLRLIVPVWQVKQVAAGETIGYDATWTAPSPRRIATLAIGYADGLFRRFQDQGRIAFPYKGEWFYAPIAGRISMDLCSCDVTDLPQDAVFEGASAFLLTEEQDADRLAATAGTIGYELLTRLGSRLNRSYLS